MAARRPWSRTRGVLAISLGLAGCSSGPLTNRAGDIAVHGPRTGLFDRLKDITCTLGISVPVAAFQLTLFFKDRRDDDILALNVSIPASALGTIGQEERFALSSTGMLVQSPDRLAATEIQSEAAGDETTSAVPLKLEVAIGEPIVQYINGEPAAVDYVKAFVPILRIDEGTTYVDFTTGETRPIEGHFEDARLYCGEFL